MKRGEDDEKIMGRPMFPRLHVNDTNKGGPRAPPRNKMALYEQLTIPSQSYNSAGAVRFGLKPNNSSGLAPSTSRNQGINCESRMDLPQYQMPLQPSYSRDELQACSPQAVNLSNQPAQMENRKKPVEEDDVIVPIFSHHAAEQCIGTIQTSGDVEIGTDQSANCPMMLLNNGAEKANHSNGNLISRQHAINQDKRNLRMSDAPKGCLGISRRGKDGIQQGQQENCVLSCSEKSEICLSRDLENGSPALKTRFSQCVSEQSLESSQRDISSRLKHNPSIEYGCRNATGVDNGMQRMDDCSQERENADRGDDVSEISMVDSACAAGMSADDAVGIMGVKQFWKARTIIASQQRALAAQVFELHRLIKVQGLFAGSPHLLLESSAFVDNTSLKDSSVKKCSSEFAVKVAHSIEDKDDTEGPKDKAECTAENASSKAPYVLAPASLPPVNADPKMNPWSFHQTGMHQWLVPVMCPSEGLVYKPCPVPGSMSPVFGGYGQTPLVGNFMNPAYEVSLGIHFGGQGYFPPYMPVLSPSVSGSVINPMNNFFQPDPYGQMARSAGVSTKSSRNGPIRKNEVAMSGAKEGELHRSTASSPSKRAQGPASSLLVNRRDALPHFPASLVTEASQEAPLDKPSRVIRVVPRDPGSTRESAARIFQSIQEERQRHVPN